MKDPDPFSLREEIKILRTRLEIRRNMLEQITKRCDHVFGSSELIPGQTRRWFRVCIRCGATQRTSRTSCNEDPDFSGNS